jgi:hypothetical protein
MSAPVSTPAQSQAQQQQQTAPAASNEPFPSPTVLMQAAKLALKEDKAIQLDYYKDSFLQKAFIAEDTKESKERILAKSKEEFTSYIKNFYNIAHKVGDKVIQTDHILVTENSIYIVNGAIKKRIVDHRVFQPTEIDM